MMKQALGRWVAGVVVVGVLAIGVLLVGGNTYFTAQDWQWGSGAVGGLLR